VAASADAASHLLRQRKVLQQALNGFTRVCTGRRKDDLVQADVGDANDQGLPIGNLIHDAGEPFRAQSLPQQVSDQQRDHEQDREVAWQPADQHHISATVPRLGVIEGLFRRR
jgi:hypothetical protein